MTSTIDVSHDDQNIVVTDAVFKWGDIDGKTFPKRVNLIYQKSCLLEEKLISVTNWKIW